LRNCGGKGALVIRTSTRFALLLFLLALSPAPAAFAQDGEEDDAVLRLAQPDFVIVNLPTSLRLPRFGSAFRIQHRFVRPLRCEECADGLLGDAFGIDNGAVINIEMRFGIVPNGQLVVSRARVDKTIAFTGLYGLTRQSDSVPLEVALVAAVEGTDNFGEEKSPTLGAIVTRLVGERAAFHLEPLWVGNSNIAAAGGDDSTLMLGVGGRIRIRPTVYLVGEATPRLSGYQPGTTLGSFAIEKRAGGHIFQLNFSNYFGSTFRQLAQGALSGDDWYMGFNISRKFF
jgi:hypothetical protein